MSDILFLVGGNGVPFVQHFMEKLCDQQGVSADLLIFGYNEKLEESDSVRISDLIDAYLKSSIEITDQALLEMQQKTGINASWFIHAERILGKASLKFKKEHALKIFHCIHEFVIKAKPKLILSGDADGIFGYMLFGIAKHLKIPAYHFQVSRMAGFIRFLPDLDENLGQPIISDQKASETEVIKFRDNYLSGTKPDYFFVLPKPKRFALPLIKIKELAEYFIHHKRLYNYPISHRIFRYLQKIVHRLVFINSIHFETNFEQIVNEPFVFYPIHLEPERAVDLYGFPFESQLLIINWLTRGMPRSWKLVCKDHPSMDVTTRAPRFWRELQNNPKVITVEKGVNSNTIITHKNCKAVATISGTAGLEACMLGVPTILWGRYFLKSMKSGVYSVNSPSDIFEVMESIYKNPIKPKEEDWVETMSHLVGNSHKGIWSFRNEKAWEDENIINIMSMITHLFNYAVSSTDSRL